MLPDSRRARGVATVPAANLPMSSPRAQSLPADFRQIYAEHRPRMRAQLARLVPASDVDDVLQEVLVKAAQALPEFRGEASLATWLHQITHRAALDHLRSRRHRERQQTTALPDDPHSAAACAGGAAGNLSAPAEAPQRLVRSDMCECIREFIGRLSPEHAEVLALKDLEGLTNAEIGLRLGISLDAAKIRLHRARTAMRQLLDRDCELYRTADNTLACDRKPPRPPS